MATRSTSSARYTRVAMWLHWLIALAIAYNLASGLLGSLLPRGFFVFHVSSGLTILILTIVRVLWRLTHRPPPLLPMRWWEARLAHSVHFLLYLAMLVLPFSGWAMISANPPAGSPGAAAAAAEKAAKAPVEPQRGPTGKVTMTPPTAPPKRRPPMFWGIVKIPLIGSINRIGQTPEGLPEQRALHERIETFHLLGGWAMLVLLILHVGGALKHQVVDREPELARMGLGHPGRRSAA